MEVADFAKSGDGTLDNVGVRVSGSFQCTHCRQKYDDQNALNHHIRFIHHPDQHSDNPPTQVEEEDEDEVMCRYCFGDEEDGELISPCACIGSQKYAHLSCLRRWQQMVLASHPTDPALQKNDSRHCNCNVCNSPYTCAPPTRHDLMVSYVGTQVAELIGEGSIIGAQDAYVAGLTRQMEEQIREQFPDLPAEMVNVDVSSSLRRFQGAYLISSVEEDTGTHEVPISDQATLNRFRQSLDDGLSLRVAGTELRVVAAGSLAGIPEADLSERLAALQAPVKLTLAKKEAPTCGDDRVTAVNLTHRTEPLNPAVVHQAMNQACEKYYGARRVEMKHYVGGPVDCHKISMCLVPGGEGRGWTLEKSLSKAIELAHSRAVKRFDGQGKIAGGQTVRLTGLQGAAHLNGELGLALRFIEGTGRWVVRLKDGETKQIKPANLEALEGGKGRVYVFWGSVCWSRTQILGEIARGQWGLCHASVQDVARPEKERKQGLDGRLVFAPINDMTEDFMRETAKP
jgi:putative AlgH/UPF0301 family transcriptional regulator